MPARIDSYPGPRKAMYTGYIIARLHESVAHRFTRVGPSEFASLASDRHGLATLFERYPEVPVTRLIRGLSPSDVLHLEQAAQSSDFPPIHSLTSYVLLDATGLVDVAAFLKDVRGHRAIDFAYREVHLTLPAVTPDPLSGNQGYLYPAPAGIDAHYAWSIGSDGAQVRFIDLERSWSEMHADLVGWPPKLVYNDNYTDLDEKWHGTAAIGVVAARDNGKGVVGLAPGAAAVLMTSMYEKSSGRLDDFADAVASAIPHLKAGDVFLLEAQIGDMYPVEIDPDKLDAIRLAVAHGIVVVECAGNGGELLDDWLCGLSAKRCLNRNLKSEFQDSGAIMAASCDSTVTAGGHVRHWSSNRGSRIDCHAWGENVWSTGDRAYPLDLDGYDSVFSGTSSAGAIVAGAAMLIQSRYIALAGSPLSPVQMRALLSDPSTGTPQARGPGDPVTGPPPTDIGVMPDLRRIMGQAGLTPDVYLRDSIGDDGTLPSSPAMGTSPDIILVPAQVADSAASFGEASGTKYMTTLSQPVTAAKDHYVYVRLQNRGAGPAAGVTALVYWSASATLLTPDQWSLIDVTLPIPAQQGSGLVVAGPITWHAADIPGPGHYCFIAILHDPADPAPLIPAPADWSGFLAFIQNSNNVAWRNFDVLQPTSSGTWASGPFDIRGAPDEARRFSLEFHQTLPASAEVFWEMPVTLAELLPASIRRRLRSRTRLPLARLPRFRTPELSLAPGVGYRCGLRVTGLRRPVPAGVQISLRQLYGDLVVGGMTWRPSSTSEPERRPRRRSR